MGTSVQDASAVPWSVQLPDGLHQVLILTRYQIRDYLRSLRFVILAGLVAVIGALVTIIVAHYRPEGLIDSAPDFYGGLFGGGITFVIILSAIFFGGDAIAGEFQNKTGYFLMGLPIRRTTVYAGKYLAAFLASMAMVALYTAILVANGIGYLGAAAFPWQLGESLALAVVYLLAVLGVTFLFSSLFKVSTYGTVLTAILFLFGFTLLQDLISGLVNITPWFIITYADTVIGAVLSNDCFSQPGAHTCSAGGMQIMVNNPGVGEGVAIMVAYFLISAIVGLIRFEHEEFS